VSWPLVKLKDVAEINPRLPKNVDESQIVTFLPMAAVSEQGQILKQEKRILNETRKGFTYFEKNDVVVAKITPCFENGKAAYLGSLETQIGFGTTEFHVIRADIEKLDAKYLFYLVWNKWFRHLGERNMSGSGGQKRVPADFLKELEIPLPPLDEQKRIAAILDKADAIRRKRQQAIQLADDFLRSVFLDMFGDPVTNPKGWKVKPIKYGLKEVKAGWSAKGESYPCKKGELGVLKISAVTSGFFKPSENKFVNKSLAEGKNLVFPSKGDLLFSRANTRELVAATCIVTESERDVFLPDKLWKITPDCSLLLPEFLHFMIQQPRFKNLLTSQATGTSGSMLNISKDKFENSIGIYPPIDMQEKFKSVFWKVNSLLNAVKTSNSKLNDNFNSLSQKAFAGEL